MAYGKPRKQDQQRNNRNNNTPRLSKEERANLAKKHTQLMALLYKPQIEYSIENTEIYYSPVSEEDFTQREKENTEFILLQTDTVSAILDYAPSLKEKSKQDTTDNDNEDSSIQENVPNKTAALNFASWRYPGGGYMIGSRAQEEALCEESDLYNVLSFFEEEFYESHRRKNNANLYYNQGLYSPDIVFMRSGKEALCDIITVAAPNRNAAVVNGDCTEKENEKVLRSRCDFVLNIAENQKVDTLILGAFGCGVFAQDPHKVAGIFKELITTKYCSFKKVIFAVIGGRNNNYNAFEAVFGDNDKEEDFKEESKEETQELGE